MEKDILSLRNIGYVDENDLYLSSEESNESSV